MTMTECEPCWALWPVAQAMRLGVVVVRAPDGSLYACAVDADDDLLHTAVSLHLGVQVNWRPVDANELAGWIASGEQAYRALEGMGGDAGAGAANAAEGLSVQSITGETSHVVRLLDATLFDALRARASDLHLEATGQGMRIRHRVDGVLEPIGDINARNTADQLISRLKIIAELDIGERRLPQDGRFRRHVGVGAEARDVDFRVSIMPSSHGEDAVIRLLDRNKLAQDNAGLTLKRLGFEPHDATSILHLATRAYGMLLVTGPTGSGKTTTLYAVIAQTQHVSDKLVTIEDPVEYQLPGVLQIPVNDKKGLTFARGLRSILRHDPDKIMVGEIRDPETAQIASQAALTGHLVLSTVHANNAFDVIGRFMNMGLDLYNLVSSLNGVVAQRLMRQLCNQCAVPFLPDGVDLKSAGLPADAEGIFRKAIGCPACRDTGYLGRRAIAEVLHVDDELREMIVSRQPIRAIKAFSLTKGVRRLRDAATSLVLRGESTLEELDRVTLAD